MAKFASKKDEEEALRACLNCGNRGFHVDLKTKELVCDKCWLNPDIYVTSDDGYLKDILSYQQPNERLKFKILREKEKINSNEFTVIFGYASEEADYWYRVICYKNSEEVKAYLHRNFAGCSNDESGEDDTTFHVKQIYYRGQPVDFDITIKH
jgi:hypothetical protein